MLQFTDLRKDPIIPFCEITSNSPEGVTVKGKLSGFITVKPGEALLNHNGFLSKKRVVFSDPLVGLLAKNGLKRCMVACEYPEHLALQEYPNADVRVFKKEVAVVREKKRIKKVFVKNNLSINFADLADWLES